MNKLACQYAVIRFLPYAETGEFANVGVALACPETGYFGTRLMPTRRTSRITGFFEQLDKRIYRKAMGYLGLELDRIRQLIAEHHTHDHAFVRQVFNELVRPREALLRFGDVRVILADEPTDALDDLYATLVERDFATKPYHDQLLIRGVRETLRKADLHRLYREATIGDDDLFLRVPFVHKRAGRAQLAIKPLDLVKAEANQVYEVGGKLVDRVHRLRRHGLLPEAMLLALGLPAKDADSTWRAANEIMADLNGDDAIQAVAATDKTAIATFAQQAAAN